MAVFGFSYFLFCFYVSIVYGFHLQLNLYDHHVAIYLLLLDRLRSRSMSQDCNTTVAKQNATSMETQRRRPSSIAEQAMRKLVISNHPSSSSSSPSSVSSVAMQPPPPSSSSALPPASSSISPSRHHHPVTIVASLPPKTAERLLESMPSSVMQSTHVGGSQAIPSLIPLRDTNIRESPQQHIRENVYLRSLMNSSGLNVTSLMTSVRNDARTDSSTMSSTPTPYMPNSMTGHYGTETNLIGSRETSIGPPIVHDSPVGSTSPLFVSIPHRTPSNRLLTSGIDQRIMKQSSEDCRRLLQQVI